MSDQKSQAILRVLIVTFVLNLLVSLAKLIYGYQAGVLSMVSDGFHSMMDGASNVVGFVAIRYAFLPPDSEHPYGHRKAEIIASLVISFMLGLTCLEIGQALWQRWWHPTIPTISTTAFIIMMGGLLINLAVVFYEKKEGQRLQSPLLLADAEHTRSDVLVTIAVLVSLLGIRLGWYGLDWVVSIGIMGVIARIGYRIFSASLRILMDRVPVDIALITDCVKAVPGVWTCHKIRAHGTPDAIYLDLHIWVSGDLSVRAAHELSHQVKDALKQLLETIADVTIHIEPASVDTKTGSIEPH